MTIIDSGVLAFEASTGAAKQPMVDSFTIRNFRSFNEAKVDGCRRINIIVGDNGSGKTALLEALFLALGVSPELAIRTRTWRGHEGSQMAGSEQDVHEALWGDLFHKFQAEHAALISLKGAGQQDRSVSVWLNKSGSLQVLPPFRGRPASKPKVIPLKTPIEFRWKIKGLNEFTIRPTFEDGKLTFPPAPGTHVKGAFHAANRTASAMEVANRFSRLSRGFLEQEFVEKFNHQYERIRGLSTELSAGAPMLFATVEHLPEKIPLALASGGMSKLAAILLSITDHSGGVLLVDEIENGFFYRRIPFMWGALLDFARFYNCQLFVSTHSEECLRAAATLAEDSPEDFAIIRTAINSSGETKVSSFDGKQFAMAIQEEMEVR